MISWKPRHKQRTNLRPKEMVRTTCTEMSEGLGIIRVYKSQDFGQIAEASDHSLLTRDSAADERKDIEGKLTMTSHRLVACTTKNSTPLLLHVFLDELTKLVDDRQGIHVALPLTLSPGK